MRKELAYWYLTMIDRPDDDIAHAEFCKAAIEVRMG